MKNKNCLDGFRCPRCGQQDELFIETTAWVSLRDDGSDADAVSLGALGLGGCGYEPDSPAMCPVCRLGEGDPEIQVQHFFDDTELVFRVSRKCPGCKKPITVIEGPDDNAEGGGAVYLPWSGTVIALVALKPFPCPHCARSIKWGGRLWKRKEIK